MTVATVRAELARFLETFGGAGHLHLAVAGPVAFAFALGSILRNRKKIDFHQWDWDRGAYRRWFGSGPTGRLEVAREPT